MPASDVAPLPRLGEVFFDVRGNSRTMRLSWYADTGVAVFSIWQGGTCTGTFRVPIPDLPRLVEALQRGPEGASAAGGDIPGTGPRNIQAPEPGVAGPPGDPLGASTRSGYPSGARHADPGRRARAGPGAAEGPARRPDPAGRTDELTAAYGMYPDPASHGSVPGPMTHTGPIPHSGGAGPPYTGYPAPDAVAAPPATTAAAAYGRNDGYPEPGELSARPAQAGYPEPPGYRAPGGYPEPGGYPGPAGYPEPVGYPKPAGYPEPGRAGRGPEPARHGGWLEPGSDMRASHQAPADGYPDPHDYTTSADPLAGAGYRARAHRGYAGDDGDSPGTASGSHARHGAPGGQAEQGERWGYRDEGARDGVAAPPGSDYGRYPDPGQPLTFPGEPGGRAVPPPAVSPPQAHVTAPVSDDTRLLPPAAGPAASAFPEPPTRYPPDPYLDGPLPASVKDPAASAPQAHQRHAAPGPRQADEKAQPLPYGYPPPVDG